jgi:hypothetical protein
VILVHPISARPPKMIVVNAPGYTTSANAWVASAASNLVI